MIAKLRGLVDSVGAEWAVIDVGGVGYQVFCSARTLSRLPAEGESASLFIETHVREDHFHLYGFADPVERDWYRLLTTVQGVGARVALAILSTMGPDELVRAVASGDKTAVSQANGVGPKLAGRIVSELKDRAGGIALGPSATMVAGGLQPGAAVDADAVSALVNLGYGRSEAFGAVARAGNRLGGGAELADLIRAGLEELAQ